MGLGWIFSIKKLDVPISTFLVHFCQQSSSGSVIFFAAPPYGVENASLLKAYKVPHVLNPRNTRRLSSWHGWIQNAVSQKTYYVECVRGIPMQLGTVCLPKDIIYFSGQVCAAMDMISEMPIAGETSLAFSSHGISFSTQHIAVCGPKQQMSFKFLSWTLQVPGCPWFQVMQMALRAGVEGVAEGRAHETCLSWSHGEGWWAAPWYR